jgi:hypothetical protein
MLKKLKCPPLQQRGTNTKMVMNIQDNPPPYSHTISNAPYICNHQNNKRPRPTMFNTILENIEPPILILSFSNPNME